MKVIVVLLEQAANVYLYLEDRFVGLYFHAHFYIQLAQLFARTDVSTSPSGLILCC